MEREPIARVLGHTVHASAPEWFSTAPIGAIRQVAEKSRLESERRRSMGNQRSVCRGNDGRDERAKTAARQSQRTRRRVCTRPPDRCFGCAHRHHPARRAEKDRRQAWRRGAVHRRRRGHRNGASNFFEHVRHARPCSVCCDRTGAECHTGGRHAVYGLAHVAARMARRHRRVARNRQRMRRAHDRRCGRTGCVAGSVGVGVYCDKVARRCVSVVAGLGHATRRRLPRR